MDPKEIFELIIKADEKLKYATDANAATCGAQQARALLEQARDASARGDGNERARPAGGDAARRPRDAADRWRAQPARDRASARNAARSGLALVLG